MPTSQPKVDMERRKRFAYALSAYRPPPPTFKHRTELLERINLSSSFFDALLSHEVISRTVKGQWCSITGKDALVNGFHNSSPRHTYWNHLGSVKERVKLEKENLNDELEDELLMKHTSSGNLKEPLDIPTWMDHLTNLRRCPISEVGFLKKTTVLLTVAVSFLKKKFKKVVQLRLMLHSGGSRLSDRSQFYNDDMVELHVQELHLTKVGDVLIDVSLDEGTGWEVTSPNKMPVRRNLQGVLPGLGSEQLTDFTLVKKEGFTEMSGFMEVTFDAGGEPLTTVVPLGMPVQLLKLGREGPDALPPAVDIDADLRRRA